MHAVEVAPTESDVSLSFLWLELTNRCNLRCIHCYADSGPEAGSDDVLTTSQYREVMERAFMRGCKSVQFIRGEPTLHKDLEELIGFAASLGYERIEVYTNLTRLSDSLLNLCRDHDVRIATSIYAPAANVHDRITLHDGSFDKTLKNLRRVVSAGLPVRVGIIAMPENEGMIDETTQTIRDLGVKNVSSDRRRGIGRGCDDSEPKLGELCGECSGSTLCVSPDGKVSACVMSKHWSIGSVLVDDFDALVNSDVLRHLRSSIREAVPAIEGSCTPKQCGPYESCQPKEGPGPCAPTNCQPCRPTG